MSTDPLKGLTKRQAAFATEYAKKRNGTASARSAGYKGNDKSLAVVASRLLKNAKVSTAVDVLVQPSIEKNQLTIEKVVTELNAIAFADWKDFVKVKYDEDGEEVISAKLILKDKLTALRILAEYLRMVGGNADTSQSSTHLHLHLTPDMTAEQARQHLINYLRQRH